MAGLPRFGIVISTYNRPDALRLALSAVVAQTETDWRAWVIGDHCDERTARVVESFADPRIHYVNLPERCGEQSGPNSVGLRLAKARYIALLNHDDIWTSDHLREAGAALDRATGNAVYMSRAGFCRTTELHADRLTFTEVSPEIRSFAKGFSRPPFYFEPVSSWVLCADLVQRLGDWASAVELHRTPLEDYWLRIWRAGASLVCGDAITVVKPRLIEETPKNRTAYSQGILGGDRLLSLATGDVSHFRQVVMNDVRASEQLGIHREFSFNRRGLNVMGRVRIALNNPLTAWLFRFTNLDAFNFSSWLFDDKRGRVLQWALAQRTGERLQCRPDLDRLEQAARSQLNGRNVDG